MQNNLLKILVVVIYIFLVYKFSDNITLLLLFTLAAILALCNISKITEGYVSGDNYAPANFKPMETFNKDFNKRDYDPNQQVNIKGDEINISSKDGQYVDVAKIVKDVVPIADFSKYQMGPYDNLVLTTGNPVSEYVKLQTNSLATPGEVCVYQGNELPLQCKKTQGENVGPPVNGVVGSPQNLFMFADNKSSLNCCPSTFSTSTGCVCTTEDQRMYVNNRGIGFSKSPVPVNNVPKSKTSKK